MTPVPRSPLHTLRSKINRLAHVVRRLQGSDVDFHPDFELISLDEFKNRFREDLNYLRFLYARGSSLYPWTFEGIFLSRIDVETAEENLVYEDEYEFEFRRFPVSGGLREAEALNRVLTNTGFAVESFCEAFLPVTDPQPEPQKAVLLRKRWNGHLSGFPGFSVEQVRKDKTLAQTKGLRPPSSPFEVWSSKGLQGGWKLRRLFLTTEDVYRSVFDGLTGWSSVNPQRLDEESFATAHRIVSSFLEEFPRKAYATRFCHELMTDYLSTEHVHIIEAAAYWSSVLRIWEVCRHWSEPTVSFDSGSHVYPSALQQYRRLTKILQSYTATDTAQLIASFLVDPCFPSWHRCWAFSENGVRCSTPLYFAPEGFVPEGDFFCELHDEEGVDFMHRGLG